MNSKLILLLTVCCTLLPTFGETTLETQQKKLEASIKAETKDTQKKVEIRSKGREIQVKAEKVISATDDISQIMNQLPNSIKSRPEATIVAVINKIVGIVGVGVRAYGRRKEAAQVITSTNEQILEATVQSFEKIQDLSETLEKLINPQTIKKAIEENRSSDMDAGKKALNLLSPSNFINTFKQFTDDKFITDNKAERWGKVKQTAKALKEEEATFDDYIAMLQIKVLEGLIMNLHQQENKDAYIEKLKERIPVFDAAIRNTYRKIIDLSTENNEKKGFLDRLKQKANKKKNDETLKSLKDEKEKYTQQKADLLQEIKFYQNIQSTPEDIKKQRAELIQKISEVKGRKVAKATPEELKDEIENLKDQVQGLQEAVDAIKPAPRPPLPPR